MVAGTLLTFIPAAGDFINSRLLGNTQTVMIGQVIDSQFLRVLDYPLAAALSFILLILIVTLVAALRAPGRHRGAGVAMAWIRRHLLAFAALAVLAYMLIPNIIVAVFSFNDPVGRYNYTWTQFSTDAWANPCGAPGHLRVRGAEPADRAGRLADRHRPRHDDRLRARSAPLPRPLRRRTCSSSCPWRRPRS